MVGQKLETDHVAPRRDEPSERFAFLLGIGIAWHDNVANHGLDAAAGELIAKGENARGVAPGQALVAIRVRVLDIEQHQIRFVQHTRRALRMRRVERVAAAIEACVDTPGRSVVHRSEQVGQKAWLQKRLPTRYGDPAGAVERAVALELVDQLLNRHERACVRTCVPGIGVVAEQAAHGATLGKHHEADARTVNRGHALDGMDTAECIARLRRLAGRFKRFASHTGLLSYTAGACGVRTRWPQTTTRS